MIKYILQLFKKLWPNYNGSTIIIPTNTTDQLTTEHNHGSLSFILDDKDNVDIYCILPDIDGCSEENILETAEKYSKLLLSVNKGLFKTDINKILKKRKAKSNDPIEQLLIENISIFYRLLEEELGKIKHNNDPIIRPTQVFKIS